MMMSPKFKRNLGRIIPFGVIWLVMSWFSLINDISLTRNQNLNPETDVSLTFSVFIFANFASLTVGLLVGTLEMLDFQRRFRKYSFLRGIIYKFSLYLLLMFCLVIIFYPMAASIESGQSFFSLEVWQKMGRFLTSWTLVNTMTQLIFSLLVSLTYAGISEHLGHNFLRNMFLGNYHRPKEERRIFMFLDMNQSTTIAEKLGHIRYFDLLQDFYDIMTEPIINHRGEVYQYVGDEVVITWKAKDGIINNHAIACFFGIEDNLRIQADSFKSKYGFVPEFKAGIHLGEVTTGVIGALKKEVVFTGDVLNIAARIQALCKPYERSLIVSNKLIDKLKSVSELQLEPLGSTNLRGREEEMELTAISRKG